MCPVDEPALVSTEAAEPLPECGYTRRVGGSSTDSEIPYLGKFLRLLRLREMEPRQEYRNQQ
jgi:hypothetical protein